MFLLLEMVVESMRCVTELRNLVLVIIYFDVLIGFFDDRNRNNLLSINTIVKICFSTFITREINVGCISPLIGSKGKTYFENED